MKFEDIKFYEHSNSKVAELGLHTPGGYWVPKHVFDEVWARVGECLLWHVGAYPITTAVMYGTEDWKLLPIGFRLKLGRCVKYLVDQEILPLRVANPNKGGTRKYASISSCVLERGNRRIPSPLFL